MILNSGAWTLPEQTPAIRNLSLRRPSTLLALAGSAANRVVTSPIDFNLFPFVASPFQQLVFRTAVSGVQLLFAVDTGSTHGADNYLSQVEIHLWPFFGPKGPNYYHPQRTSSFVELAGPSIDVTFPET